MNKEQQDIDQLFKDAFRGYEEPVFESDWSRIEQALPSGQKRKRVLWRFLIPLPIAAGIALLCFLNQPGSSKMHKTEQSSGQVNEKSTGDVNQVHSPELSKGWKNGAVERLIPAPENTVSGSPNKSREALKSSVNRRTVAMSARNGSDSESQKVSGTGSSSLGGSTGQISNELREFKGDFPSLRSRNFKKFDFDHERRSAERRVSDKYKPAVDGWRTARRPAFWVSTTILSTHIGVTDVNNLVEWKGKSLTRNKIQGGLIQQVAAGLTMNYGLTSVQIGMGESQTLNPMKQYWTVKTRMVTDSIPYRNLPGDTLFWIPVRFADTLVDVISEFSERRFIIPFRINRNIPICAKFGLIFQAGGQLGILQSMKATIPSPYTDYTWTQVRSGMAGKAQTNAPLASAEASKVVN
ncbi:MAG: hypothetical protein KJS92_08595, partial [Bacteroidetes bacterium]|nr:hypothetical protein [Bacteroidota bacterium]